MEDGLKWPIYDRLNFISTLIGELVGLDIVRLRVTVHRIPSNNS